MVEERKFDGDFEEVHQLIKASWSEEYRIKHNQPFIDNSSVEFLRWNLQRPNSDPELIMAAYSKGKLVSFVAAIPLTLKYNDKILKAAVSSFFTTHVDYQGKGIATSLGKEGLKRGIEKGYDLGYIVTDAGHNAIKLVKSISEDLELKYMRLGKFTFLAKPLDKDKIAQLASLTFHQRIILPI